MILVKIKFYENKIDNANNERDVKMREKKIHQLQKSLFEVKKMIEAKGGRIKFECGAFDGLKTKLDLIQS